MVDPRVKALKIKTGVVRRLTKEKGSYESEVVTQTAKVAAMKAASADSYEVRKAEEILAESRAMVSDCSRRLTTALAELNALIEESAADLGEVGELKAAQEIVVGAKAALAV